MQGEKYKNATTEKKNSKGRTIGTSLSPKQSIYRKLLIMLGLAIVIWIVYAPILGNGFINWDDTSYILYNPDIKNLNFSTISHLFSTFFLGNFHPITMLSFAVEYSFFKVEPRGYHVVSLFLHVVNTLLVFILFDRLTKRKWAVSVFIALLFGIHPMHLESVAWISERKDLLYTLFLLLSLIYYLKYCEYLNKKKFLVLTYLAFILSLLSKGQAVVLPIILVLSDYLLGREFSIKTIFEKIPFFIISILFGIIAIFAQKSGTVLNEANIPLSDRFFFNSFAFLIYLFKSIIPVSLSGFYEFPYTAGKSFPFYVYLAPIIVVLLFYSILRLYRKNRLLVFGFLFFTLTLMPLLILTVGKAYMAERYTYIPYLGIFYLIAVFPVSFRWLHQIQKIKVIIVTLAVVFSLVLAITTYSRTSIWKNSYSFWSDVADKYPSSLISKEHLSMYYYYEADSIEGAIDEMEKAVAIDSDYVSGYRLLGFYYHQIGNEKTAIKNLDKAIELDSTNADHYFYRGNAWVGLQDYARALSDYSKALQIDSKRTDLWIARGAVYYANLNQYINAKADFEKALSLDPTDANPWINMSITYYKLADYNNAIRFANGALARGNTTAFLVKALSYYQLREFTKAADQASLAKQSGIGVPDSLLRGSHQ